MLKSAMFRQHAKSCLRLAEAATTPENRVTLVTMAQVWHQLAQDQEQAERRVVSVLAESAQVPSTHPRPLNLAADRNC